MIMLVTKTFKEIKVGEKFFYHGLKYIKTLNTQNGKKGATDLYTGEAISDCTHWHDIQIELDPKKENAFPKRKTLNMVVTDTDRYMDRCSNPIIIKITEEQKRLVEIMYDNNMLCDNLNIDFLDDVPIIDATEE